MPTGARDFLRSLEGKRQKETEEKDAEAGQEDFSIGTRASWDR